MGPLRCPTPVYGGSDHRSAPYHRRRRRHGYCVQSGARVKVLTKKGAKADLDFWGFPFPVGFAPQKQLRARLWKHHTLHCTSLPRYLSA